jgi:CheY-like chemotaxis protein
MLGDGGGGGAAVSRRSTRRWADGGVGGLEPGLAAQAADAARLKAIDPSNVHVLVVGNLGLDEVSGGRPVVDVLRASYQVSTAASDSEALQLLRGPGAASVDLILKEHEPPSCDAAKLLARLAKSAPLRHIPVVGTSGPARSRPCRLAAHLQPGRCASLWALSLALTRFPRPAQW